MGMGYYYWHVYRDAFPFFMPFISSLLCWHLQAYKMFALFTTIAIGAATYKLQKMRANYVRGIFLTH